MISTINSWRQKDYELVRTEGLWGCSKWNLEHLKTMRKSFQKGTYEHLKKGYVSCGYSEATSRLTRLNLRNYELGYGYLYTVGPVAVSMSYLWSQGARNIEHCERTMEVLHGESRVRMLWSYDMCGAEVDMPLVNRHNHLMACL